MIVVGPITPHQLKLLYASSHLLLHVSYPHNHSGSRPNLLVSHLPFHLFVHQEAEGAITKYIKIFALLLVFDYCSVKIAGPLSTIFLFLLLLL